MDPNLLTSLFGNDIARSDAMQQSSGDVSETGEALKGPGGPFDDQILALVGEEGGRGPVEPARLSPGEFVLKQPVVAFLGDGSPEIGAGLLDILQNNADALTEVKNVLAKYM